MTVNNPDTAAFVILLAVYNGAAHLADQLNSIAAQTDENWVLLLSDDGSTDGSRQIMRDFADRIGPRVVLRDGPGQGLTAHILDLLCKVPDGLGPVAMCDQDDIWFADRLENDRAEIDGITHPALLCRRTHLCGAAGTPMGLSPPRPLAPGFGNALVQNIASGNTMVLNRPLVGIVQAVADTAQGCKYHDWWLYQIATATGGTVRHLDAPKMFYRQHDRNLVGVPRGVAGFAARARRLRSGRGGHETQSHLEALLRSRDVMTPRARDQLEAFTAARTGPAMQRLRHLARAGVYRQTRLETAMLWYAALAGRL